MDVYAKKLEKYEEDIRKKRKDVGKKFFDSKSIWKAAPASNVNLNFEHPGDEEQVNAIDLWSKQQEIPRVVIPRSQIELDVAGIWEREIRTTKYGIDYAYHEIETTRMEYNEKMAECKQKGKQYRGCMYKTMQDRILFTKTNNENIQWCNEFYLRNHKQAITRVFQDPKTKNIHGVAQVKEPDGKITTYKPVLDDRWFEHQARPGLKEYIIRQLDCHKDVVLSDFDREKKDQISKVRYIKSCLLYTSPSPRDKRQSRMPSSA